MFDKIAYSLPTYLFSFLKVNKSIIFAFLISTLGESNTQGLGIILSRPVEVY